MLGSFQLQASGTQRSGGERAGLLRLHCTSRLPDFRYWEGFHYIGEELQLFHQQYWTGLSEWHAADGLC